MANETILPRQNSDIAGGNSPSREWYNFFRRLEDRVSTVEATPTGNPVANIYSFDGLEKTVQDSSTARTLTADDNLTNIEFTNAGAITVTVNKDVLPEHSITYLTQGAAGQVTVVAGVGVTIDYSDSLKTRTQESMIGLKQIQANKFELFGDAEPVAPARSALIRSANSVGAPAFVSPTADGQVLKRSSGALVFGALTAAEVASTATGSVAATNVQAAIAELESEKQPLDTQLTTIAGLTLSGQAGKVLRVNTGGTDFELGTAAQDLTAITTDVKLTTVGNGLYLSEGSNATMGVATLVAGSSVVSTTKVTANSRIFISIQSLGTVSTPKAIGVTARTAGTSFTLTSADATDTSVIAWMIVEPCKQIALDIYNKIVAWWDLDEASGTTMVDAHTNALNGTYSGVTVNQTALAANLGKSVTFPSGNNYAEVADNALLKRTGDLSVMTWVKRNGAQALFPKLVWKPGGTKASGQANWLIQQDNNTNGGKAIFRVTVSGTNYDALTTAALADATVYQLIGVRNGTETAIWRNGTKEGTATLPGSSNLSTATDAMRIGYHGAANDVWVGSIDQTAFFNAALTSAEIAYLYNAGAGRSYATLLSDAGL